MIPIGLKGNFLEYTFKTLESCTSISTEYLSIRCCLKNGKDRRTWFLIFISLIAQSLKQRFDACSKVACIYDVSQGC